MPMLFPPNEPAAFHQCVIEAEQKYQVPACILEAVHQVESSGTLEPGLVRRNTNGTSDYGVTQINTVWTDYFQKNFGITSADFANNACLAVNGSAYIIRHEINASGDFWTAVGRYHSRTPEKLYRYAVKVATKAQEFGCQIR